MDSIPTSTLFIILFVCLVSSAFFSSSETGLLSLNKYRLRAATQKNERGSKSAEKLIQKTDKLLIFLLIFNNVVNILASSVATIIGLRLYGDTGIAVATGLLTLILLVFAEIIPKTIASRYPEKISFLFSPIITVLIFVFMPLVKVISLLTNILLKLLGLNKHNSNTKISKDELKIVINEASLHVNKDFRDTLQSIISLEDITIKDIMIPHNEISAINIDDDIKSIIRQLNHTEHNRLLVYRGSLEKNVIGTIRVREAYRLMFDTNEVTKETFVRALDEPLFVPETTIISQQLMNFKSGKNYLAIAVDEYGHITGLITMEDILEEIVGDFTNSTTNKLYEDINETSKGTYIIDGSTSIRDLNKTYEWNLQSDDARTINGYLLELFQDIPKPGTNIIIGNLSMTIIESNDIMVKQVQIIDLNICNNN